MKVSRIFLIIGTAFFAAAICLALYNIYVDRNAGRQSDDVYRELEKIMLGNKPSNPSQDSASPSPTPPYSGGAQMPEDDPSPSEPSPEGKPPVDSPIYSGENQTPDYLLFPEMEMPEVTIDSHSYIGMLSIPALNLKLPIMSKWSYKGLKIAPGRYFGSVYSHDLVICGHNYSSCFRGLKNMPLGEKLYFTDMNGNEFVYTAVSLETIHQYDVEDMISEDYDMTIFTCASGGVERVTLRCVLENKP